MDNNFHGRRDFYQGVQAQPQCNTMTQWVVIHLGKQWNLRTTWSHTKLLSQLLCRPFIKSYAVYVALVILICIACFCSATAKVIIKAVKGFINLVLNSYSCWRYLCLANA